MSPHRFGTIFLLLAATTAAQTKPRMPQMSRFGVKYDEALEAIFSVAVRLEALLTDTGVKTSKNFMVSPLSMAVAIGELMLGARGDFRDHLYSLLVIEPTNRSTSVRHLPDKSHNVTHYALHAQLGDLMQNLQKQGEIEQGYKLKTASVLFTSLNLTIKDEFKENISKFYGTQIKPVDFQNNPSEAEKIVNQWAIDSTQGLIKSILPGPVSSQTSAILANAVYFKGDWEIPFSSEVNRRGVFKTNATSSVNVTFMLGEFENYRYVDSKAHKCRMVMIPYENSELTFNVVMPHVDNGTEYDINKFVASLKTRDILDLIAQTKERKVFMILPKMALSNTINVLEPLKRYHKYKSTAEFLPVAPKTGPATDVMNATMQIDRLDEKVDAFKNTTSLGDRSSDRLDLGGISEDSNFQISSIYQQMTLSVNEKGTEAAAVSASAIDYILESVNFRVDRPFLFFIRHETTEASLFWGTIVDPTENVD